MFKWLGGLVDSNEKEVRRLQPVVDDINALESHFHDLNGVELKSKTDQFKARLKNGETLEDLIPEAFAAVREAARRTIGQRHYDVQLLGGMVLHQGKIAEMKTGEGKTLVATLPLYLNALSGKGCHLVTVNDYLARRDAYWMGPIYHALGMTVASIFPQQNQTEYLPAYIYDPDPGHESTDKRWPKFRAITRKQAYEADITYGTNNEFGFDYLRDNMVIDLSQCVQRELNYAIVDEVDNILIDEARTPLIISGAVKQETEVYEKCDSLARGLKKNDDYTFDEKKREVYLEGSGTDKMERRFGLRPLSESSPREEVETYKMIKHRTENALKARELFKIDRDYVVRSELDNDQVVKKVIIVDEFTGRLMFGRRYSEELHEALEAKEGVKVQTKSVTLATITFQNYFRIYEKLAGMTGTAATEAEEFYKIYKLEVVVVPTNKPMIRIDNPDQIYKDEESKFKAVANEIESLYKQGRPVLVGTVSIEKSEYLSDFLKRKGIRHELLNAKNHTKEADIIAQAGKTGAVTVATNMAGRGVDILLGGKPPEEQEDITIAESAQPSELNKETGEITQTARKYTLEEWQMEHDKVVELGGLHVVGTERHEARRIDNQLRGRSGRQGDPGSSRFYVSLEDDIVRRFGGDKIKGIMEWAGMDENTPIEHSMINKAIENAQVKVEGYHFDMRKHLVEYDDIVNKHREIIYAERKKILSGADLKLNILSMVKEEIKRLAAAHCSNDFVQPDLTALIEGISTFIPPPLPPEISTGSLSKLKQEEIENTLVECTEKLYEQREKEMGTDNIRLLERLIMLKTIDDLWKEHLTAMDDLRQKVGLESMRQIDPLVIYKKEGHAYFESLLANIQHDLVHTIFRANITLKEASPQKPSSKNAIPIGKKVGRNDPCPCGSGKKYKHCCGH